MSLCWKWLWHRAARRDTGPERTLSPPSFAKRSLRSRLRMAGRGLGERLRRMSPALSPEASEHSERSRRRGKPASEANVLGEGGISSTARRDLPVRNCVLADGPSLLARIPGRGQLARLRSRTRVPYPAKRFVYIIRSVPTRIGAMSASLRSPGAPGCPQCRAESVDGAVEAVVRRRVRRVPHRTAGVAV